MIAYILTQVDKPRRYAPVYEPVNPYDLLIPLGILGILAIAAIVIYAARTGD